MYVHRNRIGILSVGFYGGRIKGRKNSEQGRETEPKYGAEPGPHWWERSDHSTAPSYFVCLHVSYFRKQFVIFYVETFNQGLIQIGMRKIQASDAHVVTYAAVCLFRLSRLVSEVLMKINGNLALVSLVINLITQGWLFCFTPRIRLERFNRCCLYKLTGTLQRSNSHGVNGNSSLI